MSAVFEFLGRLEHTHIIFAPNTLSIRQWLTTQLAVEAMMDNFASSMSKLRNNVWFCCCYSLAARFLASSGRLVYSSQSKIGFQALGTRWLIMTGWFIVRSFLDLISRQNIAVYQSDSCSQLDIYSRPLEKELVNSRSGKLDLGSVNQIAHLQLVLDFWGMKLPWLGAS